MHIAKVLLTLNIIVVTENRETLGRLIDITIYLGKQELAFGGHNESENSFNQGNFRELAKLLSPDNDKFKQFLDEFTIFTGLSKTIQNEIIQSINNLGYGKLRTLVKFNIQGPKGSFKIQVNCAPVVRTGVHS
jgi:ERCC4-related helicase